MMKCLTIVFILRAVGGNCAEPPHSLREGLVLHAGFDGGAGDTLLLRGAAAAGEGRVGGGIHLDGKSACLAADSIPHRESLTWSMWFRSRAEYGGLVGLTADTWSKGGKGIYLSDHRLKLDVGWVGAAHSDLPLDDGEWHHVALTVEPTGEKGEARYRAYVDGRSALAGSIDFYRFDARSEGGRRQEFRVGHLAIADAGFLKGDVDEVALWRRALSEHEVRLLHAFTQSGPPRGFAALLDVDTSQRIEPGARFRLFWLGEPQARWPALAPDQSPNIDRTVPALASSGAEDFFADGDGRRYGEHFLAAYSASLDAPAGGLHRFRVASGCAFRLAVDGAAILASGAGRREPAEVAWTLDPGAHRIEVQQHVESGERGLRVEWRGPRDEAFRLLDADHLRAESFYFRPTDGGRKRLQAEDARPGDRMKLAGVHPGYRLTTVRPPGVEVPVGGMEMLPDGRLAVAMFDGRKLRSPDPQPEPDGALWILSGVDGDDRSRIEREVVASDLFEPVGVCVVGDFIFVSQRGEVTRFERDTGGAWRRTAVASGWETNDFHQMCFGLVHRPGPAGHPGFLYLARSVGLGKGRNPPGHGAVWRIDLSKPATENREVLTGGHRTPNGIGVGPEGEIFVTDNQGEWTPSNELNHILPGHFYGYHNPRPTPQSQPSPFEDQPVTGPAIHLPQDEISNSPTQPILIPPGQPYAGQMLVGDMKYGGIDRLYLEKVGGVWQGAAFRFSMGFEAGPNRLAWGRGGTLFVGEIGGDHGSTWAWNDAEGRRTYQGLQRLTPTGITAYDLQAVRAIPGGFEIELTKPADAAVLAGPDGYRLRQWRYQGTSAYGGPKLDEEDLTVAEAVPQADGLKVRLRVGGLKEGRVVYLRADPPSRDGEALWTTEAWYTMNRLPER